MSAAASNETRPNKLVVCKADHGDQSVIALSARRMEMLALHRGDTVLVKGRLRKDTILIVVEDSGLDDQQACIAAMVRRNLRVRLGDSITVLAYPDITYARRIAVLPVAETIHGFTGSLFDVFLAPYFRQAYRPVRQGDFFVCKSDHREIEFKVLEVDPPSEYAIVFEKTVIHSEGAPIRREVEDNTQDLTSYEDVGGCREQLDGICELINIRLKFPQLISSLGIRSRGGILLHGPPGAGKTHIARAIANESGMFFFLINGPEVLSNEAGKSEANLRLAFEDAGKNAPSILFIDELDSIAPKRDSASDPVERRLVSQLMTLMDGLRGRGNVVVMAASNRLGAIDPSLRRYGRFDREIEIGIPDSGGRLEILEIHTKFMKLDDKVDLVAVAALMEGYVGADIAAVCDEAAMQQIRGKTHLLDFDRNTVDSNVLRSLKVTMDDFRNAVAACRPASWRDSVADQSGQSLVVGRADTGGRT